MLSRTALWWANAILSGPKQALFLPNDDGLGRAPLVAFASRVKTTIVPPRKKFQPKEGQRKNVLGINRVE